MLTEICQYLKNWFVRTKYIGEFTIRDGSLQAVYDSGNAFSSMTILPGQYFRIVGSALNDGVHQHPSGALSDETFEGAIWTMAVPAAVVSLAEDIENWQCKYGGTDSQAMSPFASESFGGYSYTKASGVSASGSGSGWEAVFASRLSPWRKI